MKENKKDIENIYKLICDEDIEIEYYKKDGGKVSTNWDCYELLDYINNLEERIDKALDYIKKIYNSNTEIVENSKGEHIDVGYAVPALEDIEDILKGDEQNE